MDYKTSKKVNELIETLTDSLRVTCERLYSCGGIDPDKYDHDNYVLAKLLLTASIKQEQDSFAPLHEEYKTDLKNLMYF